MSFYWSTSLSRVTKTLHLRLLRKLEQVAPAVFLLDLNGEGLTTFLHTDPGVLLSLEHRRYIHNAILKGDIDAVWKRIHSVSPQVC